MQTRRHLLAAAATLWLARALQAAEALPAAPGAELKRRLARVSSSQRIAMYTNIDDQWLASCTNDCGKGDSWQRTRISTCNYLHSAFNASTLGW